MRTESFVAAANGETPVRTDSNGTEDHPRVPLADAVKKYCTNPDKQTEGELRTAVEAASLQELLELPEMTYARARARFMPEQETINIGTPEREAKRAAWGKAAFRDGELQRNGNG